MGCTSISESIFCNFLFLVRLSNIANNPIKDYYEEIQSGNQEKTFHEIILQIGKKHRKVVYVELLTSGKLDACLHDIDIQALERYKLLVKQYARAQGITEQLKTENKMEWIGRMNNISACAEEAIMNEIIYI